MQPENIEGLIRSLGILVGFIAIFIGATNYYLSRIVKLLRIIALKADYVATKEALHED